LLYLIESSEGYLRVDDHDLSFLAVRASCTVQEHRVSAGDGHVECSDICLAILKGDVSAVHTGVHGRARLVRCRLGHSVVSVAELELDNITDCGHNGVGYEGVLWSANDYRDDLALAAMQVRRELRERRDPSHDGKKNAEGLHDDSRVVRC
jgi:hypothetical protein